MAVMRDFLIGDKAIVGAHGKPRKGAATKAAVDGANRAMVSFTSTLRHAMMDGSS